MSLNLLDFLLQVDEPILLIGTRQQGQEQYRGSFSLVNIRENVSVKYSIFNLAFELEH